MHARLASSPLRPDLDNILAWKPEVWERLRGKSIFLTGGTGWFGRWLLEAITHANSELDTGIRVLVLSRNPAAFAQAAPHLADHPLIRFQQGDVRDFAYPDERFSHFIHAATTSAHETFNGETPLAKFDTLVGGTRRVLDFAARAGAEHFLFTSSGAAYGRPRDGRPLGEDDDCAPDTTNAGSALGQAKRAAEFLCAAYAEQHGWNLSVARCFSFVGPFMPLDIHYAIGNFIRQALDREAVTVKGDGSPIRSYLYTADLVVWLLTLLQREGKPRSYNVGSDQGISIRDLASLVRDIINPGGEVQVLGKAAYSVGNPVRDTYFPNIDRARSELELDIWTQVPDAIRRTAEHAAHTIRAIQHL